MILKENIFYTFIYFHVMYIPNSFAMYMMRNNVIFLWNTADLKAEIFIFQFKKNSMSYNLPKWRKDELLRFLYAKKNANSFVQNRNSGHRFQFQKY